MITVGSVIGSGIFLTPLCISVFGAANPSLLSSPRAFYAMAKDGTALPALPAPAISTT